MQEVRTVSTMTSALLALGDWMAGLGVTRVVMEATSDYWRPPFYLLEDRFETWLVNAKDVKHLPGRPKTDRLDAVWLCKVAERQMLRPSFVPPPAIRELRDLTRYRVDLVLPLRVAARHSEWDFSAFSSAGRTERIRRSWSAMNSKLCAAPAASSAWRMFSVVASIATRSTGRIARRLASPCWARPSIEAADPRIVDEQPQQPRLRLAEVDVDHCHRVGDMEQLASHGALHARRGKAQTSGSWSTARTSGL
jgi:hypothetical protein